jgi:plastocyanin
MALPASGTLSFSNLQTEFTGVNPISLSEYYKSGNNGYVPTTVPEVVTASSLTGSYAPNARYPAISGYDPQINTFSRLYTHALWGDNGSTGSMDMTFTVNKTGTYNYYFGWYIQGTNANSGTTIFYVNGSQQASHNLFTTNNSTNSVTGTLTVSAGQSIRIYNGGFPSAGWSAHTVYIGGSSYNNSSIDLPVNANIPTSGVLSISDYYGGRKT